MPLSPTCILGDAMRMQRIAYVGGHTARSWEVDLGGHVELQRALERPGEVINELLGLPVELVRYGERLKLVTL